MIAKAQLTLMLRNRHKNRAGLLSQPSSALVCLQAAG